MSLRYRLMRRFVAKAVAHHGSITVEQLRSLQGPPSPPLVDVRGVTFWTESLAGLDVEIAEPADATADLLFLHGGGCIAGTPSTQRKLVGAIAREAAVRVWSPDYRLAPEHPYPAAVDDAVTAYRALLERVDSPRVVLAGESGGGLLAATALLRARDVGLPPPAAVVLLNAWTDLTLSGTSTTENVGKDFLTPPFLEMCRDAYVGEHDPADPQLSPLFANLAGLPPTLLQVGDYDLIRDDSVRYAKAAGMAGSPVDLRVWPKAAHGFMGSGDDLPESRAAITELATWLRTALLPK